jgi:hypothetical protein
LENVECFGTLFESFSSRLPAIEAGLAMAALTVRIPITGRQEWDGIISFLRKKHAGHVHHKGIVTLTSKSVHEDEPRYAPLHILDDVQRPDEYFVSEDESGQWICLDFGQLRVRPTHYRIIAAMLKSWVVEGSLSGTRWTEMDWRNDNKSFEDCQAPDRSSSTDRWFAMPNPAECRFIRLTQTSKNSRNHHVLMLGCLEFFGELSL